MKVFLFSLMALFAAVACSAHDAAPKYQEGEQYELIQPKQPTEDPNKIEVVEVFWYGCPHCFAFEPYVASWLEKKPDDVTFIRMPAPLNPRWQIHARAFYVADVLGVLDEIHTPLFDAIHKEHRSLNSQEELKAFFVENGVSGDEFDKAWASFAVDTKLRHALEMARRYGITGVPTFIVDGKYRTGARIAGGPSDVLDVVTYLVDKVRAERKASGG